MKASFFELDRDILTSILPLIPISPERIKEIMQQKIKFKVTHKWQAKAE